MLVTRTPFRMSFFGGGTDYYEYFSQYGGSVLSTTIDKYCYVTIRRLPELFDYKNQFTYSKIERFNEPDEVKHPLVREVLKYIPTDRIQIAYDADLPACSGIGSSSAFAVGLIQGLRAMHDEYPDKITLAKQAIHLERELCDEAGGVQDQIAAAVGGFNRIDFSAEGYKINPVAVSEERLEQFRENLLMMFTGFTHFSGQIAIQQKENISSKIGELHEMKSLVDVSEGILTKGDLDDFGRLLDYTWKLKRTLSESITNPQIDEMYRRAKENGALGGKLLGAGGGGFMLLYVPQENREKLMKNMGELNFVPVNFENSGTKILYKNNSI